MPWTIRQLTGIVCCPQMLADGTLVATPGYHAASGLYLDLRCRLPVIPPEPTLADAQRAADRLLAVVRDFPFADEASRSVWLAHGLTACCRHAIDGPVPMATYTANCRGTGKTLLASANGVIYQGHELAVISVTGDDAEMRKRITAILLAGTAMPLLDNAHTIGGDAIDALMTARTWQDRVLGESLMTAELPATAIWAATGNNITYTGDSARRVMECRLETLLERPEERPTTEFRHADLLGWLRRHRGPLMAAAITMVRAFDRAGRPDQGLTPWGGYEHWSALVRGCIVWCGLADPGETRQRVHEEADADARFLAGLLDALEVADSIGAGLTTAQICSIADGGGSPAGKAMKAVFADMAGQGGKLSSRAVGNRLAQLRRRWCDGRCLDYRTVHGYRAWRVSRASEKPEG